jgi:hypothetical protein
MGGPAHGHLRAERADPVRVEGRGDQRGPDRAGATLFTRMPRSCSAWASE